MTGTIDEIYRRMNDDIETPEVDLSESKIREFFAGKKLLLSGATGYVGRVFIEKILRDCPQLGRLYVLVREKKGVAPEDKMKKYFENAIFDKLRNINPDFSDSVTTISGDLQADKLGLSARDRRILTENVEVIVHTAATTRFDERPSVALKINVLGTNAMLDLAMDCQKIQAFVHVSTGYSHCYRKDIGERFYESPADLELIHELIARDEQHPLDADSLREALGKWPNIYTFSKAVAEGLVEERGQRAHFPMAVYRPTIIVAAREEPTPGWVNANNGVTLTYVGIGLGIVHAVYYDTSSIIDIVPVDLTVNCLVAVVYDIAQQWKVEKKAVVYNYGSRDLNPVNMNDMTKWLIKEGPHIGSTRSLWYPFVICTRRLWQFWILHVIFHFLPALIADLSLLVARKKPRALRMFFFATKNISVIDYFSNGDWRIRCDKAMRLYDRMNKADQTIFDFDVRKLDWESMTVLFIRGARLHILKESFDNLEQAKKRFARIKIIHYVISSSVLLLVTYFAINLLLYVYSYFIV